MPDTTRPAPTASRPVAASVAELLDGAVRLGTFEPPQARSTAAFERYDVDGEACVVKYVHPDLDYAMRAIGDLSCLPRRVWEVGLMDSCPSHIDHATLGVAPWGANDWGAAILMRDVSADLIAPTDEPVPEATHATLLDALAALSATHWHFSDDDGLLPHEKRWQMFAPDALAAEAERGYPEPVPRIATQGWERFGDRAPLAVRDAVAAVFDEPAILTAALAGTPVTFLHGDWKFGNLGVGHDGRCVLIDWTYTGAGPVCHELAWYLALNRGRIPSGHTKESTTDDLRSALERHGIDTNGWWDRQLAVCLLGAVVQFGWEKALGDDDELGWWCDRALEGARFL